MKKMIASPNIIQIQKIGNPFFVHLFSLKIHFWRRFKTTTHCYQAYPIDVLIKSSVKFKKQIGKKTVRERLVNGSVSLYDNIKKNNLPVFGHKD